MQASRGGFLAALRLAFVLSVEGESISFTALALEGLFRSAERFGEDPSYDSAEFRKSKIEHYCKPVFCCPNIEAQRFEPTEKVSILIRTF